MFICIVRLSGKSLIIYLMLIFNLLRLKDSKQDKILIIVPTTSLVEQLFKDFKDYGYNSERNVHRIYQGISRKRNKQKSYNIYLGINLYIIYQKMV